MVWSASPTSVLVTAAAGSATIWLGYAVLCALLRRAVFARNRRDVGSDERQCAARARRAAATQVFLISWVWILHGAVAAWLVLPHQWWMVFGLFIALMAAVGRTSYRILRRFDEIRQV